MWEEKASVLVAAGSEGKLDLLLLQVTALCVGALAAAGWHCLSVGGVNCRWLNLIVFGIVGCGYLIMARARLRCFVRFAASWSSLGLAGAGCYWIWIGYHKQQLVLSEIVLLKFQLLPITFRSSLKLDVAAMFETFTIPTPKISSGYCNAKDLNL